MNTNPAPEEADKEQPDINSANEIFGNYVRLIDELFRPSITEITLLAEAEQKAKLALYQRLAAEAVPVRTPYADNHIEMYVPLSELKAIMEIKE